MIEQRKHVLCAEWLHWCLRHGWAKADLDALQALWWRYEGWRWRDSYPD